MPRRPATPTSAPRSRLRRGLAHRPAQSVPLQLRSLERRHLHRRRRPGISRGDRLPRPRSAGVANWGWRCYEGNSQHNPPAAARSELPLPHPRLRAHGRPLLGHRRLPLPRQRLREPGGDLPLRRLLHRRDLELDAGRRRRLDGGGAASRQSILHLFVRRGRQRRALRRRLQHRHHLSDPGDQRHSDADADADSHPHPHADGDADPHADSNRDADGDADAGADDSRHRRQRHSERTHRRHPGAALVLRLPRRLRWSTAPSVPTASAAPLPRSRPTSPASRAISTSTATATSSRSPTAS